MAIRCLSVQLAQQTFQFTKQLGTPPFIYNGPGFPITNNPQGFLQFKTDVALVVDSITQILGTRKGERLRVPTFGSVLSQLQFEPDDQVLADLAASNIADALHQWEPRLRLQQVTATVVPGEMPTLQIVISGTLTKLALPVTLRYEMNIS